MNGIVMNGIIIYFVVSLILTVPVLDALDNVRTLIFSILFCPIVYIVAIFQFIAHHTSDKREGE